LRINYTGAAYCGGAGGNMPSGGNLGPLVGIEVGSYPAANGSAPFFATSWLTITGNNIGDPNGTATNISSNLNADLLGIRVFNSSTNTTNITNNVIVI